MFVCLVSSWEVRERTGHKLTHEYLLVKKNMAEKYLMYRRKEPSLYLFFIILLCSPTKISKKGSGDFAEAVGFCVS